MTVVGIAEEGVKGELVVENDNDSDDGDGGG